MKHELSAEHKETRSGKGRQDQLVVLQVETSKFYIPSEPTSTYNISQDFFRSTCLLLLVNPVSTLAVNKLNYLHVLHEHEYNFGLINFVKVLILTNVMKCHIDI